MGRFDDLLSLADVERLISSTAIRTPGFRLVKAGATLAESEYTREIPWRPRPFTGAIDVERVAALFEGGATIVLQGLHTSWEPLAEFCRGLEIALEEPVQANAYYTPASAQGLAVHHDTHDVFVLQLSGEKRWLLYEPELELPLRSQRSTRGLAPPGRPVEDLTLVPGDTLYLPRGWLHEALTSEHDSLHLTVGVNVYTWLDAFEAALAECAEDIGFRRSVAAGGTPEDDLLERLADRLRPAEVAQRRRKRFVSGRRPIRGDLLEQRRALERLTTETTLERRESVIADLEDDGEGIALLFEGRSVRFPARARLEVEFAAGASEPFRAADLPGSLDQSGRLVLVRRLVREGFLRLCQD